MATEFFGPAIPDKILNSFGPAPVKTTTTAKPPTTSTQRLPGGGSGTPPKATPTKDPLAGLSDDQKNAYEQLESVMNTYGLGSLASTIISLLKQGRDSATIEIELQNTNAWKQRFAGNEIRKKNGLAVLDPATYLATEAAMKDALRNYGLPTSFYDQPADFANLIGNDVSPNEVSERAQYAWEFTKSSQSTYEKQLLKDWYGVDDSHIAAYFLDPAKGEQLINQQGRAIQYANLAKDQGINIDKATATNWFDQGVTASQVAQGVQQAAEVAPNTMAIAKRFGQNYTMADALNEGVLGNAAAQQERQALNAAEESLFAGKADSAAEASRALGVDSGSF